MTVYQEWTLDVQVNLGKSIFDSILGTWTSLGAPLSFSMDRGKSDKLGTYDAGTCTVVLDNSDAALDQLDTGSDIGSGQALPGIPFRVRATKGATTVTLFYGYTLDGFNPSGSFAGSATVSVTATDWLGWTAGVDYPDSLWGAWVSGGDYNRRPLVWYRGDANRWSVGSGDSIYNSAYWSGDGFDLAQVSGSGGASEGTSLVPGSSSPSIELDGPATFSSASTSQSGTWSTAMWYKSTASHANTVSFEGSGSGGDTWAVWIDATTGYAWARVKVAGVDYSPHIAVDHNDGDAHLVCVRVVSTGGTRKVSIYSDLDTGGDFVNIAANQVSGGGALSIISDGAAATWPAYFPSWLADVAYFADESFPPASGPTLDQWVADTADPGTGDTCADRLTRFCDACGVPEPTWDLTLDDPALTLTNAQVPASLSAAVQSLGETWLGGAYCLRDGSVRIRDASFTSSDANDFTTVQAQLTDDPSASAPPTVVRLENRSRTGTRMDRVYNHITVTKGGQNVTWARFRDVASIARYGLRPLTFTTEAAGSNDVQTYAADVLAANKDPLVEVSDVVISPRLCGQDVTDFVFEDLELDRKVTYREATPDNGTELLDASYRVIGERWDMSDGVGRFTVTLRLAPA